MTPKQQIHATLTSWVEAHHVPGGYGGRAALPSPDATEGGPWGYLRTCLTAGAVYFAFLDHASFRRTWMRAIRDLAQERVFAMLPPGAVLAGATSSRPDAETSEAAREAIASGAVVGLRTDEDGEPEYLILSPATADAAVYLFGARGHRRCADSVGAFVAAEVARLRAKMSETFRFSGRGTGARAGWLYGTPPSVTAAEWPRHAEGGFPLAHAFTLELPEAYRVRRARSGAAFVALSFFHPGNAEAVGVEPVEGVAELFADPDADVDETPLLAAVRAHARALATPPSDERLVHTFVDVLGHTHAVVFHTEASYRGGRAELPAERGDEDLFAEIFETFGEPEAPLNLAAAGERREVQLGRPLHPMQGDEAVRAMGLFVMELSADVGGANFGDGTAQLDLESGAFDWAC